MTLRDLREFTFENYYKQISLTKENNIQYYLVINSKKIPDPSKAKEHCELFLNDKAKQIHKHQKL